MHNNICSLTPKTTEFNTVSSRATLLMSDHFTLCWCSVLLCYKETCRLPFFLDLFVLKVNIWHYENFSLRWSCNSVCVCVCVWMKAGLTIILPCNFVYTFLVISHTTFISFMQMCRGIHFLIFAGELAILTWDFFWFSSFPPGSGRGQFKCDGTRAETRFSLLAKWTSPFKSVGASV